MYFDYEEERTLTGCETMMMKSIATAPFSMFPTTCRLFFDPVDIGKIYS